MTKRKTEEPDKDGPDDSMHVTQKGTETEAAAIARAILEPDFRAGLAVSQLLKPQLGKLPHAPGMGDYSTAIKGQADAAAKGDLAFASRMLATQAMVLDTIFAEMTRRMALNMGEYISPTEIYGRLAMKAQANSRATLEALAKLHQPREQTVRHVHVNEGGQAVIADQFHHHQTGGQENGKPIEQPHTPEIGAAGTGAALPSPDSFGNRVQIPSGERCKAMSDARRQG